LKALEGVLAVVAVVDMVRDIELVRVLERVVRRGLKIASVIARAAIKSTK